MGRTRKANKHLPPRMQMKRGNFYYTPYVSGKVQWKPLGNDYVQALLKWRDLEGLTDGAETVSRMLENALAVVACTVKASTLREHTRALNSLKGAFEGFTPADVEPRHIASYLANRSAKVAANREVSFFSTAWNIARNKGWINLPNPTEGIKRNKEKDRKRTATEAEMKALTSPDEALADMAALALMTGMRESDLLNLSLRAIETKGIRVKPQKTETTTQVEQFFPWTPEMKAVVDRAKARRHRIGSLVLFPVQRRGRAGQPYTVNSFQNVWRRYFERCGVTGLTWHDLRRTALNMRKAESGTEAAKDMGAHSSLTTTEGYLSQVGTLEVRPNVLKF